MTWWLWVLLWVVLVAGAIGVLFLIGRSLWRKGMALAHELAEAGERLSVVAEELQSRSGGEPAAEELAVFRNPAQVRADRITARRSGLRGRAAATTRSRAGDRSAGRA